MWNKGTEEDIFRFSINLILTPSPLEHGAGIPGERDAKERPSGLAVNKLVSTDIHFI